MYGPCKLKIEYIAGGARAFNVFSSLTCDTPDASNYDRRATGMPRVFNIRSINGKYAFSQTYLYVSFETLGESSNIKVSHTFSAEPQKTGPLKTPLIIYNETEKRLKDGLVELVERTNKCTNSSASNRNKLKTMFKGKIIERRGEITLANKAKMSMWNNHEQDRLIRQALK